ncbi:class I SAM-dependent methyltransferase [Sandaracinus amylolyticus]|uniref:SAM-dependent methyltransferase n=1 Tax=Sandaracinus amylolyticus TaxID=927083 RepID=A0A0F6SHB0_9BACT|nr:class I SAM-dependent methyltransferase [Sandaracinus amylolyticus]AKF10129.1 SAM-dependent methyltransferase [Sandaracinus amylolyticus]
MRRLARLPTWNIMLAMNDVEEHYEEHLAAIYAWSVGGAETAIAAADAWLAAIALPAAPALVIDLGAGFGATAIPLARRGHRVIAVDTSQALLDELATLAGSLPIATERAELVAFLRARREPCDVVLCLGDTLAHLGTPDEVDALLAGIAQTLAPSGIALLSYRPRREFARPEDRFVLVRADARRTLTCVLEPIDETYQRVWDVLHEHEGERTTMRVSGYRKLRLDPAWIAERARAHGLVADELASWRGMTVQRLSER